MTDRKRAPEAVLTAINNNNGDDIELDPTFIDQNYDANDEAKDDFFDFVENNISRSLIHEDCVQSANITFEDIEDSIISDSTLKKYLPDLLHFFFWMMDNSSDCLTEHCRNILSLYISSSRNDDIYIVISKSKKDFLNHLRNAANEPLLRLEILTPQIFLNYLIKLRNRATGTYYGRSAYNQRRSALFHCYRLHNKVGFDPMFKQQLSHLYSGLFRWLAKKSGGVRRANKKNSVVKNVPWSAEDPKLPLSVEAYKAIAGWFLSDGSPEALFAHCFLIMTWNLACRSQNTADLKFGDINWNTSFDSFTVKFAHSKTDQSGEDSKYARHIYANPFLPQVCPVLSIAFHLSYNFSLINMDATTPLFPGKFQNDRFGEMLTRCLTKHAVELKNQFGYNVSDIGTHSIRKGAATFLTSLPGGPSAAATCIRGGWTMGNVKDRYFRYSEAGDQFVGRCLCLLNLLTVNFSCSPPFFNVQENSKRDKWLDKIVVIQFPVSKELDGFALLGRMCTASLLYHRRWIVDSFPNSTMTKRCNLFKQQDIKDFFDRYPNVLTVKFPWNDGNNNTFSGVPPHVALLNDLKTIRQGQENLMSTLSDKINEVFRESQVNSAVLTKHELLATLDTMKNELMDRISMVEKRHDPDPDPSDVHIVAYEDTDITEREDRQRVYGIHTVGGRIRRVPEDWRFPTKVGCFHIWRDWWIGDDVRKIPPIRMLSCKDIDFIDKIPLTEEEKKESRSGKRRPASKTLSDLRYLINILKKMVEEEGAWTRVITINSVDQMFKSIEERLLVKVRDVQKSWRSVVREMRENGLKA